MSRRNKLEKFADLLQFPNVYENYNPKVPQLVGAGGTSVMLSGEWSARHFSNDQPITLELACGRGEYTLALAHEFPYRNFIGVDVKGARIWKGASQALDEGLKNVAFLRTRIEQIDLFFAPEEVDEIWITFPDPFLRKSKANRRLTSPFFLQKYRNILQKDGIIHLKTDEPNLFAFTLETVASCSFCTLLYKEDDIYAQALPTAELAYQTYYEKIHRAAGKPIKYVKFKLG